MPNIKTIVYREQQQQQLTTLIQVCGSVDDRSRQTQQCDEDTPLYSGGAAAVIGHYSDVPIGLSVNVASKGAWFRGGNWS